MSTSRNQTGYQNSSSEFHSMINTFLLGLIIVGIAFQTMIIMQRLDYLEYSQHLATDKQKSTAESLKRMANQLKQLKKNFYPRLENIEDVAKQVLEALNELQTDEQCPAINTQTYAASDVDINHNAANSQR